MSDPGPVRRPPSLSVGFAVVAAAVVTLAFLNVPPAAGVGALGIVFVTVGLVFTIRPLIEISGATLGLTVIVGGAFGAGPAAVSVAALAAVVAFDVADHAHDLGQRIGRDARTRRNELAHAGGSLLVGGIAGGVAYGVFLGAAGGQPVTALSFLLAGAIALVVWLR